jgi:2-polyprenyl-3-methyl-5-hydroxy-6-metoxy-1,4-benzoquinol methylase
MERARVSELLEDPSIPEAVALQAYRDLARTEHLLGNQAAIFRALRAGPPVSRVLDIGCGHGAMLEEIRDRLHVDVVGFELRPAPASIRMPILVGNAARDPLPTADVALAICMVHHLTEPDVVALIRNVSKTCRRFIILDLVRHWIPLALFRVFLSPFLHPINAADGATSVQRAFTPRELRSLVDQAVEGTGARLTHTVAPFYTRQMVEITWP